ncbi:MAG: hypothetical protein F4W89_00455 [Acidobacteria bacterium]|nr:hypothetical protein [Acidobacteriota bacterium]
MAGEFRRFKPLFRVLSECGARYVVIGGVATILHGFLRFTKDLDVVVDLEPAAARRVIDALKAQGFLPHAPVDPDDFADRRIREAWTNEKGMKAFSMFDGERPWLTIDLFIRERSDFEAFWARAETKHVDGLPVRIASIEDLLAMKRAAGRSGDREDIERLEQILADRRRPPRARDAALDDPWQACTWQGMRDAQFRAGLAATPAQRIEELEDMIEFVHEAARHRDFVVDNEGTVIDLTAPRG